MSEHIDKTVAQALEKLREQEGAVAMTKRLINQLLEFEGRAPMFEDVKSATSVVALRGDEYYGQKQSTACRLVLERRKALNLGPATVEELFATLKEGGYAYEARDESMAMKSIYNMLTQNTSIFHRLPTGKFGLATWYPNAVKVRRRTPLRIDDDENRDAMLADSREPDAESDAEEGAPS